MSDNANSEFLKVLEECIDSARTGRSIAIEEKNALNKILWDAQSTVSNTITRFNNSKLYSPETAESLQTQLNDIRDSFLKLENSVAKDINDLQENLNKFSITLFGRTMAGKSTVMEILTKGDGSSIGKGAQRTTLDIRKYMWNGLEITDVPGVGAFEGAEDEKLAFDAAKKADLILFLLTDDAPQVAEEKCFSRIVSLGKPVIGIINVKSALSETKISKVQLRNLDNCFNTERLDTIKMQFLKSAELFGQNWEQIPFVYVHLKAAFLALTANDELKDLLYEKSRFDYLEQLIIDQIKVKGKFYRIKTFIDTISNPLLEAQENLLSQSYRNFQQTRLLRQKRVQLETWRNQFRENGQKYIKYFIATLQSKLFNGAELIAEDYYESENAGDQWNDFVRLLNIEYYCNKTLTTLNEQCQEHIKEISREFENELKYIGSIKGNTNIHVHKINDVNKKWNWTMIGAEGIATGGLLFAVFTGSAISGPLGIASIAIPIIQGLGNGILKSRKIRIKEARDSMENSLRDYSKNLCEELESNLLREFYEKILNRVHIIVGEFDVLERLLTELADIQRKYAWSINDRSLSLNMRIISEAFNLTGDSESWKKIQTVARVPGNIITLVLKPGNELPADSKDKAFSQINEKVNIMRDFDNKAVLISELLDKHIDKESIKIDKESGIAYIHLTDTSPLISTQIELAQQITKLYIVE